jgi:hypothetical protein
MTPLRRLRQLTAAAAVAAPLLGAAHDFSAPAQIRYDAQCMTVDGQDVFISSVPFEGGEAGGNGGGDRLRAIKAAGFNAVTVPSREGAELAQALHLAHREFGLYSIVDRPRGVSTLAAVALEQITRGGPVPSSGAQGATRSAGGTILVRLPPAGNPAAAYREVLDAGIDVPVFTVGAAGLRDSLDPLLGRIFDGLAPGRGSPVPGLIALASAQPDAPLLVYRHEPLSPAREELLQALLAIEEGATILSINWSDSAWPEARRLNGMLALYGSELARTHGAAVQAQTGSSAVTLVVRKARSGATYLFLANLAPNSAHRGRASLWLEHEGVEFGVDYGLPPRTGRVMRLPPNSTDTSQVEQLLGD